MGISIPGRAPGGGGGGGGGGDGDLLRGGDLGGDLGGVRGGFCCFSMTETKIKDRSLKIGGYIGHFARKPTLGQMTRS